ncbi:MAG: hypothetical protein ACRC9E_03760 [Plesiomonas shigelloides]
MVVLLDKLILLGLVAKDLALLALSVSALIATWYFSFGENKKK